MKKISDYRKQVEERQALLRGARTPEERQVLLNMTEIWEAPALAREKKLARQGRTEEEIATRGAFPSGTKGDST